MHIILLLMQELINSPNRASLVAQTVKNLPTVQKTICNSGDHLQCRRLRFEPWVRKIPWRWAWQLTLVFLLGKFHGQRNLVGNSPWGSKELNKTE